MPSPWDSTESTCSRLTLPFLCIQTDLKQVFNVELKNSRGETVECLKVLNELNRRYKWARFSLDPTRVVICEIDVPATSETVPEITFQMLASMIRTADEAYVSVQPFEDASNTVTDGI